MGNNVKADPTTGQLTDRPGKPSAEDIANDAWAQIASGTPIEVLFPDAPPTGTKKVSGKQPSAQVEGAPQYNTGDPPPPDAPPATSDGQVSLSSTVSSFCDGSMDVGDVLPLLLKAMATLSSDQREDEVASRAAQVLLLASKSATLKVQSKSIEKGMEEAAQKADIAMNQAVTALVIGCVQGCLQIAGGFASMNGGKGEGLGQALQGAATVVGGVGGFYQNMAEHDKLMVDANSESSKLKIKANFMQALQNEAEARANNAESDAKAAKDLTSQARDALMQTFRTMSQASNNLVGNIK